MAKRFKLRFSKAIPSFLLCRSKHPNRLHTNPVPVSAIYRFSPLNRKSCDIHHPRCLPNPPPSTPISFSDIAPDDCGGCSGGESSNDGDVSSTSPLKLKKRAGKRKGANLNVVVRSRISSSSGDSGWFSSDEDQQPNLDTSRNFSTASDHIKSNIRSKPKRKATNLCENPDKTSTFGTKSGMMESVAIEKRSDDPLRDFKSSMAEMIVEKEITEVRDLEDLLQCFLTLNSRQHHNVIVEAFTETWESLFSESPLNRRRLFPDKKGA